MAPHTLREMQWLGVRRGYQSELTDILGTGHSTVLDYLLARGTAGFVTINRYLDEKNKCIQNNDRYLLCLGLRNTIIATANTSMDFPTTMSARQHMENPAWPWAKAVRGARTLASAAPIGGDNSLLLKRPYLDALIAFIKDQPNLDVAIITEAGKDYVDAVLSAAAPELLSLCKFIWTQEDSAKFIVGGWGFGRAAKGVPHVTELMEYQSGRIFLLITRKSIQKNPTFIYHHLFLVWIAWTAWRVMRVSCCSPSGYRYC